MDRRERAPSLEELLRSAFEAMQARIWTALPGVVQSYNAAVQTVVVQPAINGKQRLDDGTWTPTQLPLLLDVPVQWQGGGGATLTFPIKKDDECLVVFSSRCIDRWFAKGFADGGTPKQPNAENNPPQFRMHNLSDGYALVGVRSAPRALPVDTVSATLMSDDASTSIKLNPITHAISMVAPGGITMLAAGGITLNGVTIDTLGNVIMPLMLAVTTGPISVAGVPVTVP
jgi:hypothetical protein